MCVCVSVCVCVCVCVSDLDGFGLGFADVAHVGPLVRGHEGGEGPVGLGQRQVALGGDVGVGTRLRCGVHAARKQTARLLQLQLQHTR